MTRARNAPSSLTLILILSLYFALCSSFCFITPCSTYLVFYEKKPVLGKKVVSYRPSKSRYSRGNNSSHIVICMSYDNVTMIIWKEIDYFLLSFLRYSLRLKRSNLNCQLHRVYLHSISKICIKLVKFLLIFAILFVLYVS
ncbi:hypothetical protein QTP88_009259 [Uroleucon formosanum]